ncbi:MAG: histidine kinase dimerization/phosphoacceptor domain -containing protein [Asticcacaulis sp.]
MLKVLIVEDDLMIADMTEDFLVASGYSVSGIARTVAKAVELAKADPPDLAIVDLRLAGGDYGTQVASELQKLKRTGILFASGNITQFDLTLDDGDACLAKPYLTKDLLNSLAIISDIVATGSSSLPHPRGFRLLKPAFHKLKASMPDDIARIHKLLRQQAAIAGFGSFALREGDLHKVLTEAARVCASGLDVPFSKVCRYRPVEKDLLVEAGHGWKPGVIGNVVSRADESSPQGRAFITGEPSICNDLRKDTVFKLPAFYADHGIVSTVDVVIHVKDKQPYGILEIDNNVQHDYDQHDIDFLTGFANVLAEAVATSARLELLQTTVQEMKSLVAEKDRLLDQKKVLAEELQHRVRNNLQLIYGMLTKQLDDTTDEAGQRGLRAIARRVFTLAKVYENLLGTEMTHTTDFGSYVKSLCANLAEIQDGNTEQINLTCKSVSLLLDLDMVTALGIIVAELVTNSYDHAFPGGRGTISVSLTHAFDAPGQALLTVRDDGTGLSNRPAANATASALSAVLVEQVGGEIELTSDHGAVWAITFPVVATADDDLPRAA